MIKNYLSSIDGVAIFPVISFVIFFASFCLVLLVTFFRGRAAYDEVAALPLVHDEQDAIDFTPANNSSRYEDQ